MKLILESWRRVLKEEQENPLDVYIAAYKLVLDAGMKNEAKYRVAIVEIGNYIKDQKSIIKDPNARGAVQTMQELKTTDSERFKEYYEDGMSIIKGGQQTSTPTKTTQTTSYSNEDFKEAAPTPPTYTTQKIGDQTFIIATVKSSNPKYSNIVGTGKARLRGDQDFSRDSAASDARINLLNKIKGNK